MGAQKRVEKTVRQRKTEQASRGSASLCVSEKEKETKTKKKRIPKPTNIFKRF